jgi:hypothetical protein
LDTRVCQYDFPLAVTNGFFQWQSNVYWLSVRAFTASGLFGWKTSINHFGDAAVWTWQLDPEDWEPLSYPPWHPDADNDIDLSFGLTTLAAPAPLFGAAAPPQGVAGGGPSSGPTPMALSVSQPNGVLTLWWTGNGRLQWAPEVTGPWTTVMGATNPYVAPANLPHCFFRVIPQ